MSKKQWRGDEAEGAVLPELTGTVELSYPDGAKGTTHEHYYDPLQPLAGPIDVTPRPKEKKKKKSPAGPLNDEQIAINRARRIRYDSFIEHLIEQRGDRTQALALTYGLPAEEIKEKHADYLADVLLGMSTSSVGDLLENAGLGKAARIGVLARHAYSEDPKVSLVAVKLATDLDGDKHNQGQGSYEKHLLMALGRATE